MQETHTSVQQRPLKSSHAGLQLCLHVWLCDYNILQPKRERVFLQNIHKCEELIQVWILHTAGEKTCKCTYIDMCAVFFFFLIFSNFLFHYLCDFFHFFFFITCVWTEEAAVTSTLKTPLWLSTHFIPGSCTWNTHRPQHILSTHSSSDFTAKQMLQLALNNYL